MPTYQYVCTSCERPLEAQQSFSDSTLTECPACAGRLRKVFSAVGVVFKGSGFYRNDSRVAPSDGGDSAKGDGKDSKQSKDDTSSTNGTEGKDGKQAKPKDSSSGSSAPKETASSGSSSAS